jgi:hypothetical protein
MLLKLVLPQFYGMKISNLALGRGGKSELSVLQMSKVD